ncbi:MAG: glutathione S-transferase N-terminal domain-containing protein, partial [Gammaproteobacteria bacterium]|nr:glutathione S-transferase N-terminal domain-containing protein [Gammaproteobacteria bacterium]
MYLIDAKSQAVNDLSSLLNRRPSMTLLSGQICVLSHCVRIVLLEKDVECTVDFLPVGGDPSRLVEHNPYGETPTLVDRDISLYDTSVILEYLDERFPHPPLMPADPITRAKTRLMISRLNRDWLRPICELGDTLP